MSERADIIGQKAYHRYNNQELSIKEYAPITFANFRLNHDFDYFSATKNFTPDLV